MDTSTTTTASATTRATATASDGVRPAGARDLEPLLTLDELAAYLGLPKQTLYDWRVNGRGPRAYRIGKHLRFTVRDIRAWVDTQHEPAPAASPGG
jgi:excisionase family DNA binding protein